MRVVHFLEFHSASGLVMIYVVLMNCALARQHNNKSTQANYKHIETTALFNDCNQ